MCGQLQRYCCVMTSPIILLLCATFLSSTVGSDEGQGTLVISPSVDKLSKGKDESIVFTCSVEGSPGNVNLRWFKNGNDEIRDKQGRVYIEQTPRGLKLYIKSIRSDDAGSYGCESDNLPRKTVRLEVYEPIRFIAEPKQTKIINTDARIDCVATGNPLPDVFWSFGGSRVTAGDKYVISSEGLIVKDIRDPEDAGTYTCHAEVTDQGFMDEQTIEVEVHTPPTITKELSDTKGTEDSDVMLSCQASGKPTPKYSFFREVNGQDEPLTTNDRIKVNEVTGELQFVPAKKEDDGTYVCKAINDAGERESRGTVHVLVKPRLVAFADVIAQEEGDESDPQGHATLTCEVTADPPAEMKFIREDTQTEYMEGENDGRIKVTNVGNNILKMVIERLTKKDTAAYRCHASNQIGKMDKVATLNVQYKPKFHEDHPKVFYVWAGKTREMTCSATGEPEPRVSWKKNGGHLDDTVYSVKTEGRNSSVQMTLSEDDLHSVLGDYDCHAENDVGSSHLRIKLQQATAPVVAPTASVSSSRPTSVVLKVDPPTDPEDYGYMPVTSYDVQIGDTERVISFTAGTEVLIPNLSPSSKYILSVAAVNEVGTGPSFEVEAETIAETAPYAIKITSDREAHHAHDYLVQWDLPEDGGKPIIKYTISYRTVKVDKSDPAEWKVAETQGNFEVVEAKEAAHSDDKPSLRKWNLGGLLADMYYEIKITATNEIGTSPDSAPFIFHTSPMLHHPGSVRGTATASLPSKGVSVLSLVVCFTLASIASLSV